MTDCIDEMEKVARFISELNENLGLLQWQMSNNRGNLELLAKELRRGKEYKKEVIKRLNEEYNSRKLLTEAQFERVVDWILKSSEERYFGEAIKLMMTSMEAFGVPAGLNSNLP